MFRIGEQTLNAELIRVFGQFAAWWSAYNLLKYWVSAARFSVKTEIFSFLTVTGVEARYDLICWKWLCHLSVIYEAFPFSLHVSLENILFKLPFFSWFSASSTIDSLSPVQGHCPYNRVVIYPFSRDWHSERAATNCSVRHKIGLSRYGV